MSDVMALDSEIVNATAYVHVAFKCMACDTSDGILYEFPCYLSK